jgi:hypothetical protein
VSEVDTAERLLLALLAVAFAAYTTSYIIRDYWSALGSAVLALVLAAIVIERRCRRCCGKWG